MILEGRAGGNAKRVRFVEQSEHSECGITSVTMLLNYLGVNISLNSLRDKYGVPKGGNTLFHLKSILQEFGISTSGYRVSGLEFFKENNNPCILFGIIDIMWFLKKLFGTRLLL